MNIILIGALLLLTISASQCEIFTCVVEIENLLPTQELIIKELKRYIKNEGSKKKLDILKRYLKIFKVEHKKATSDVSNYIGNPINAFTLMKRLMIDLINMEKLMSARKIVPDYVSNPKLVYPSSQDLFGAAASIARLQHYYKLNASSLAEGKLIGSFGYEVTPDIFSPMTASDCYHLAKLLGSLQFNEFAVEWFTEALDKLASQPSDGTFTANDVVRLITTHESRIDDHTTKKTEEENMFTKDFYSSLQIDRDLNHTTSQLCRGEIENPYLYSNKMYCTYLKRTPFLRLAPIKMEKVYDNPEVFLFYDVMGDEEIRTVTENAKLDLTSAKTKYSVFGKFRLLHEEKLDLVKKIRLRTTDMTGYITGYEPLHPIIYGIGGMYDVHYDAPEKKARKMCLTRMSTVLFYLSEVRQGGSTVWPYLRLAVRPKKGMAVQWKNLQPNGDIDKRMLHAACPVLSGYKWVQQFWIDACTYCKGRILICPGTSPPVRLSYNKNCLY